MTGASGAASMLEDSVDRFVRERCTAERQAGWRAGQGSTEVWRELAELGWIGLSIPEEAGGVGGGAVEEATVTAGIGRGLLTVAFVPASIMAVALMKACPGAGGLLADLATGRRLFAVASDEPGRRFGAPADAGLTRDGSGYRLTGRKSLVLGLTDATDLLIVARDASTGETAIAHVDPRDDGLGRREFVLLDGSRAFDLDMSIAVDPDAILLRGPVADVALASARDRAAIASAAEAVGAMRGAVEATRAHLATRRQFGQPLASFQTLRHRFADMACELELAESIVWAAAARLEEGQAVTAPIAKARADKAGRAIGEAAVQLHGGIGVTEEYVVGQYYKRLLVLETRYGSRDQHLERLGADYHPHAGARS